MMRKKEKEKEKELLIRLINLLDINRPIVEISKDYNLLMYDADFKIIADWCMVELSQVIYRLRINEQKETTSGIN